MPEFLTVPELADLLRIKERKVYDLASAGEVPCTRATGKLLFPEAEVRAWIEAKRSGTPQRRPDVFLGSHDPLLEWALRQSQCGLATYFDGSGDGLDRFMASEGVATGLHIREADDWNVETVRSSCSDANAVLLSWAVRHRGLVMQADAQAKFASVGDVAGHRVAVRQPKSGTAELWGSLLNEAGLSPADVSEIGPHHSEQDAVLAVADGDADVTFGLSSVARQFNLAFVPLVEERFDILVDRGAFFDLPMQTLLRFCQDKVFAGRADALGYDIADLGQVRWNA